MTFTIEQVEVKFERVKSDAIQILAWKKMRNSVTQVHFEFKPSS